MSKEQGRKKVRILGRAVPLWLLTLVLIAASAGAAVGTVLAGKITGEIPVAVSQALLAGMPEAVAEDLRDMGVPQSMRRAYTLPDRSIGTHADDQTAFQFAAEINTGDDYLIRLPLKNASDVDMVAQLSLMLPNGITAEVFSSDSMYRTPTIDGVLSPGEWGSPVFTYLSASAYTGLVDIYITNDASNLYIAARSQTPDLAHGWTFPGAVQFLGLATSLNIYIDSYNDGFLGDPDDLFVSALNNSYARGDGAGGWLPETLPGTFTVDSGGAIAADGGINPPSPWTPVWPNPWTGNGIVEVKIPFSFFGMRPGYAMGIAFQTFGYTMYPSWTVADYAKAILLGATSNATRIGPATWKFQVGRFAEKSNVLPWSDTIGIVVASDDVIPPGFHTIRGESKQIGY